MIDPAILPLYMTLSFLLIIAPGPDIILLATVSVDKGPRPGLKTALGLAAGNLFHTTAVALGVSVIIQSSPLAFNAIKILGAAYLLYLAYKMAPMGVGKDRSTDDINNSKTRVRENLFLQGFIMNMLNPKVALFFISFLPQFTNSALKHIWLQIALLGLIFAMIVAVIFGTIGIIAGRVQHLMEGAMSRMAGQVLPWIVAIIFAGLALRLLLQAA